LHRGWVLVKDLSAGIRDEPASSNGANRRLQPRNDFTRPGRQGVVDHRGVARNLPSDGIRLRKDDDCRHSRGTPSDAIAGNPCGEPHLRVERSEQALHRTELRLDLDDEERCGGCVPCKDVDRATLAVFRKAHFDSRLPALSIESRDDNGYETRMSLIQDTVECSTVPRHEDRESSAENIGDCGDAGKGDAVPLSAFDS
jgi:hypothetical protein